MRLTPSLALLSAMTAVSVAVMVFSFARTANEAIAQRADASRTLAAVTILEDTANARELLRKEFRAFDDALLTPDANGAAASELKAMHARTAAALTGMSTMPRPCAALAHLAMRSMLAGSADAYPTTTPR